MSEIYNEIGRNITKHSAKHTKHFSQLKINQSKSPYKLIIHNINCCAKKYISIIRKIYLIFKKKMSQLLHSTKRSTNKNAQDKTWRHLCPLYSDLHSFSELILQNDILRAYLLSLNAHYSMQFSNFAQRATESQFMIP